MNKLAIVVVSLPSSIERRQRVTAHMKDCRHAWRFFDALADPALAGLEYDECRALVHRGRKLSPGELGCYASHVSLLRQFAGQRDTEWIVVIEDDVLLDPSLNLLELCESMSLADIEYLRLYARYPKSFRNVVDWKQRHLIRFTTGPYGTQAYLISTRGAQHFLHGISEIARPVDDELDRFWNNGLPIYALYPFPAIELESGTTVNKPRIEFDPLTMGQRIRRFHVRVVDKVAKTCADLALIWRDRKVRKILRQS
jgi:glycosyl transferase family 25